MVPVPVFIDLKRAFETLDKAIKINELRRCGIDGTALIWFRDYLSGRTQLTKFGEWIYQIK